MAALAVASVSVALITVVCGVTIWHRTSARLAGGLLAVSGACALLALWLNKVAHPASETALVISGLILFPASLWAYPRPRWRHPVDLMLATALIAPGFVAAVNRPATLTMSVTAFLALVAQTWWRLEKSDVTDRRPLSWLALTASVVTLVGLGVGFLSSVDVPPVSVAVLAAVPVAMAVGVLRPETVDVRGLAVSATVGVTLVIGYLSYFVGTLAALELLGVADVQPVGLAVIGLFGGLLLRPVGRALRAVMDNLLFGERPDPLVAATEVVGTIGESPAEALNSVRSALNLPFVELRRGGDVLAQSGLPVTHTREIAASDISLRVGLRTGDLRLPASDEAVLHLVTPLLVQLVRATDLSSALQQMRTAELNAVAEERRRLRAELHDDLGPTLAGIAFSTDAARNLIEGDPAAAMDLLDQVRADIAAAIAQIRQIAYGMRPAALAELGLVEAIRQHRDSSLRVVVDSAPLPELGAATEVAAYRVITEALTNAARHSRGSSAVVALRATDTELTIEVSDDGPGAGPWQAGVGMTSMRERVTELGGSFSAGPGVSGGTVRAVLPVTRQSF